MQNRVGKFRHLVPIKHRDWFGWLTVTVAEDKEQWIKNIMWHLPSLTVLLYLSLDRALDQVSSASRSTTRILALALFVLSAHETWQERKAIKSRVWCNVAYAILALCVTIFVALP